MSYYKDVKILVYVKRGAYTVTPTERNVEKFNMLKVLMATAFRDVEPNARHLSRGASIHWHENHCALEIDMPSARWEPYYDEVKEIHAAIFDLSGKDHQYCAEFTVLVPDSPKECIHFRSSKVTNSLLKIEVNTKVNL